jgi:hypothetical protein
MALSVKKAALWRREIVNRPGTFAESLKPFSKAGVNLQVVMGYTTPQGAGGAGAVEVFPVTDAKAEAAAKEAGLHQAKEVHCVVAVGSDRAGIAYDMANTIGAAGINLHFAMCQAVENQFHAILGFDSEADADKAVGLLSKL